MRIRWLQTLALLGCTPAAVTPAAQEPAAQQTAAPNVSAVATEAMPVGALDYKGSVCTAGNPAEGPLPPPDLPA